jgi:hypothetical protein
VETNETLGGILLREARDLNHAIALILQRSSRMSGSP